MIKFFYKVIYQKKNQESTFDLGVFSNLRKAKIKIEQISTQKGFKDWLDGFRIVKFGVRFPKDYKHSKENIKLYNISHEYEIEESGVVYDIYKIFDIVSSFAIAKERVEFLKQHTQRGKKYPDGFEINTIIVDNYNSWSEGFDDYEN